MAFQPRLWQLIQQQIKANVAANPTLAAELTSTSPVSHWQLWTFVQALASNLNEQAAAVFISEVEAIITQGAPQTAPWIQAQILLFQYNTATPYLVGINNGVVGYATVAPADRIISNCAVVPGNIGIVTIKVTTGNPAGPLNASQIIALKSYLTNFLSPNQQYTLVSSAADKLQVWGTVYYNGQLNASIQGSVIQALTNYITAFSTSQESGGSFNGLAKVSDIAKVIEDVEGVVDFVPSQITVTPSTGSPVNLILANTLLARSYNAYSGYLINDPGNPFSSTLTFTPAQN